MSKRSPERKIICTLLAGTNHPLSRDEIARITGFDTVTVKTHLRHMVADGEVRNVSKNHMNSAYVIRVEVEKQPEQATPRRLFVNGTQRDPLTTVWGQIRAGAEIAFELPSGGVK